MVMVDGLGVERECKKYLEGIVENLDDERLTFVGHKHQLRVKDADSFHKIAQATENKEISEVHDRLIYYIEIPRKEGRLPDDWTVSLDIEENNNFLTKYGKQYKIE